MELTPSQELLGYFQNNKKSYPLSSFLIIEIKEGKGMTFSNRILKTKHIKRDNTYNHQGQLLL